MSNRITIEELQSYLWNSAVLLRTSIDAGAYKQYIFPLLFFKRICDVYDEECVQILEEYDGDEEALEWEENHRFNVPKGAHWKDVRSVSENIGSAMLNTVINAIKGEMNTILTENQMKMLEQVLTKHLSGVIAAETEHKEVELLPAFISAKRVEGCSEKSLRYYESTI